MNNELNDEHEHELGINRFSFEKYENSDKPVIVFLGTGCSSGIPRIDCIVQTPVTCNICMDAWKDPESKNRRRNPSLLIYYKQKFILIDCGKSFREGAVRILKKYKVPRVDAVLITHPHADAYFGLDDIREWIWAETIHTNKSNVSCSVYVAREYFHVIQNTFPYLVDSSKATGSGLVASLKFELFEFDSKIDIFGLQFVPLLVEHGNNCTCLGFHFSNVIYLSDVSFIPDHVREYIHEQRKNNTAQLFILDCLKKLNFSRSKTPSHLFWLQSLEEVNHFKFPKTYFIGMSHDIDYYETYSELQQMFPNENTPNSKCFPSFDGLGIDLNTLEPLE